MTFAEATEQLMARGVTLQEMGAALGVKHTTVRAFRLDPATDSYRRPPEDWAPKLARLARERSRELEELAGAIEAHAESGP